MPKQKDKVRQSVEAGTGDKAVEPAARQPAPLCDDMPADFMSFVRSALNAVNKKLDNIMIQQSKMETKLSDIEATVTGHATAIQTITETVRELEKSMEYTSENQHHLTQTKLPELSSHLEQLASALVLRTLDMEVHSRKWNLIIRGVKGPANENECTTREAAIVLATTGLRVVNAANSRIAACHRLNNKENAPIIVKFCDLSERNRWLDGGQESEEPNRTHHSPISLNPDLPPTIRNLKTELLRMKKELPAEQKARSSVRYIRQWPYVKLRVADHPTLRPQTSPKIIVQSLLGLDPLFKF